MCALTNKAFSHRGDCLDFLMAALTEGFEMTERHDPHSLCDSSPVKKNKKENRIRLIHTHTFAGCSLRSTSESQSVSLCFPAGWICLHEIERFSCWFAVKWCAWEGLGRVSFSVESNRGMTEREERRGEEVWSTYCYFSCSSPLDSHSSVQFGQTLRWRQMHMETQTRSIHTYCMCTSIKLQVRAPGAQEGGRARELSKQRSVTVVEGEPPSNEREERRMEGWELDEGFDCII